MNKLTLKEYDLHMTLLGGQSFAWDYFPEEETYYGAMRDKVIKLKKEKNVLSWQTFPKKDNISLIKEYLRANVNYPKILQKIEKDKYIKKAIKQFPNIRLLKQDFEQTLLSFLISSNNNIRSIRKIVRTLNKRFGRKVLVDSKEFYLFPETEVIANARLEDLLECKLGFRAKYIKGAAQYLTKTNLSSTIQKMKEEDARKSLTEIKGVGNKIADCILVFSLCFDNLTPLDVWGKRFLNKFYGLDLKTNYNDMRIWINNYFSGYGAWAGQFLFEYIRQDRNWSKGEEASNEL